MIEEDWKANIRSWAKSQPDVAEVYLFGSRAKGVARPDSDLDIGVVIKSTNPDEDAYTRWFFNADGWRGQLAALLPVRIDLQIANPEISTDIVAPAVKAHGVLIFARDGSRTGFDC